ncbi:MAG: hypothetical protein LQ342_006019 [Letrouitia transgressa]|nr:MAG: hypothetical protein LQ342_006019 [Letrouitia transgressa]
MASLTKSNKSNPSTQSDTKAKNGLTADPVKYAAMMRANHGVQKYGFATPTKGSTHEQHGLAAEKVPANYKEIIEALAKDRDDLPGMNEFAEYCSGMDPPNISPKESEIEIFYRDFLNPKKWRREAHSNGRFTLILQPDLLPTPPDKIEPEMCMGIDPNKLGKRSWVGKHLPGHVRNRLLICINSVVEHKSSEGSIITARIQNQAAAKLLCDAWLVDEQTLRELRSVEEFVTVANSASQRLGSALVTKTAEQLPSIDGGVIGRASIGSLCFDGNTLEASVHWLDESNSSVTRKYDMFSLRVGTGHVFAVDLAEFQATYKKFANFLDWLFHVRDKRLQQIMTLPESEFSTLAKPMPNLGGRANKPALLSPKEQGRQPDLQPAILDSQPSLQVPQQSTNSTAEYFSTGKVRKQPTRDQQKMKKRKRSDSNVTTLAGATTSRSKKRRSTRAG